MVPRYVRLPPSSRSCDQILPLLGRTGNIFDLDLCGHVAAAEIALVLLDVPRTIRVHHGELLFGMFLAELFLKAFDVFPAMRANIAQGIPLVSEFLGGKWIEK